MGNNIDFKRATKIVKYILPNVDENALNKVTSIMKNDGNSSINIKNIKVPIITDDESIREYIKIFELDKPLNMIKFFVESYYANVECIADGIGCNQKTDFCNSVSYIKTAKRMFDRAMSNMKNSHKYEQLIIDAQNALDQGITQLEEKIFRVYIPEIRKIDNRGKLEFFLKAKASLSQIDINTELARESVKTIVSAVQLHMLIASASHDDIYDSVIRPFEEFKNNLLSSNNCTLMYDYDNEKERSFWTGIADQIETICDNSDSISECIETCIEDIVIL